jgi:transaldolase/glucose-6-phosphate isomerase
MDTIAPRGTLAQLAACGTSVWLDFVSRPLLQSGDLRRMIEQDDLRGMTSNPSIFEKAIAHGDDYDADLTAFARSGDRPVSELFEHLAVGDIQSAADALRPVYDRTGGVDGYISLEVSPYLALRTEETIAEARHLWAEVDRPNLMVKVPGTEQGVPAIETLIGDGININVTLLFSIDSYRAVAEAYMAGLEKHAAQGGDLSRMASVASFFVSRIDSAVEKEVEAKTPGADAQTTARLQSLRGKVAIANAKMAYQLYKKLIASPRWLALAAKGARPQRLLWASTGTKLKGLPDTLYVDTLIGPDTVNTMPPATMDAVRDHGTVHATLDQDVDDARAVLDTLRDCGISLDAITTALVTDGVQQFADAADRLYGAVAAKRAKILDGDAPLQTFHLSADLQQAVDAEAEYWRASGLIRRLWSRDKTVWTGADEDRWLGWLTLPEEAEAALPALTKLQHDVKTAGFKDAVLLGMGGSSLGPEVLAESFGHQPGFPRLHIVDSTDPAQLRATRDAIDLAHTLFIVSSKSGSTLEPNIFKDYFLDEVRKAGLDAGGHFIAITDPGSDLEKVARQDGFRRIFHGVKSVGGRFSVLSMFGMVPAAVIGLDLPSFLARTREMQRSCLWDVPPAFNPGVQLGLAMGVAATRGRDKVTLIAAPEIGDIGAWLEQLIAESTGKQGHGIVPIDLEPPREPAHYGADRLFVHLTVHGAADAAQKAHVTALEQAGQPVVRITLPDRAHLGQEFFRFEIATAVAGAVIGIDPFDQPDVEASKVATRALMDQVARSGHLPDEQPIFEQSGIALFADPANAAAIGTHAVLADYVRAHLARVGAGDYIALLAYCRRDAATRAAIQHARATIGRSLRAATAAGFGPRFLHSTGQAYKGGPNSGVFLQITCADPRDLPVPGKPYGFGAVKAAQALGDLQVLNQRGRRALRIHLGGDLIQGLAALNDAIAASFG